MERTPPLLFSTKNYVYLKETLLQADEVFQEGQLEYKIFPDGESYHRIGNSVAGRSVVVLGGTINDEETLELYDICFALVKFGAKNLDILVPYFGYSTMERAVKQGEIVKAKTRASLFSSLPRTALGNRILLFDLHTEGIPYYFERGVLPIHIYGKPLVVEACKELGGDNFVLACTDAGRAKWVESLANDMGVDAAFVFKKRLSERETSISAVSADVNGKTVILYDDMIRTGGSLIKAAEAYQNAGAVDLIAICSHGLFTEGGFHKLKDSGLFSHIVSLDTHPNTIALKADGLETKSIAPLIINFYKDEGSSISLVD
ncbi:MAG: ribose-phosphate diphosphokinase [Cyclobacteriaceae bacterium]|nr:ribose-phosphate pyrophosphokinase [Cyclobacteriaceae bacterium]MCH8516757.1 ribose-phosphate diphosphokinase [Cyclobacteriaceae bacterium]